MSNQSSLVSKISRARDLEQSRLLAIEEFRTEGAVRMPRYLPKIRQIIHLERQRTAGGPRVWMFTIVGGMSSPRWEYGGATPAEALARCSEIYPHLFQPDVELRVHIHSDGTARELQRVAAKFFGDYYSG